MQYQSFLHLNSNHLGAGDMMLTRIRDNAYMSLAGCLPAGLVAGAFFWADTGGAASGGGAGTLSICDCCGEEQGLLTLR
jgi:hypothetical protein